MSDASELKNGDVKRELDCRGDLCPLPVYKTRLAMNQLKRGEILRLVCSDKGSLADIPALARQAGYDLLSSEESGAEQRFLLRK